MGKEIPQTSKPAPKASKAAAAKVAALEAANSAAVKAAKAAASAKQGNKKTASTDTPDKKPDFSVGLVGDASAQPVTSAVPPSSAASRPSSRWDQAHAWVNRNAAIFRGLPGDAGAVGFALAGAETLTNVATGAAHLAKGAGKFVYDGTLAGQVLWGLDMTANVTGVSKYEPAKVKTVRSWLPNYGNNITVSKDIASMGLGLGVLAGKVTWDLTPGGWMNATAQILGGTPYQPRAQQNWLGERSLAGSTQAALLPNTRHVIALGEGIYDQEYAPLVERGEYARIAGHVVTNLALLFAGGAIVKGLGGAAKTAEATNEIRIAAETEEAAQAVRAAEAVKAVPASGAVTPAEFETLKNIAAEMEINAVAAARAAQTEADAAALIKEASKKLGGALPADAAPTVGNLKTLAMRDK